MKNVTKSLENAIKYFRDNYPDGYCYKSSYITGDGEEPCLNIVDKDGELMEIVIISESLYENTEKIHRL